MQSIVSSEIPTADVKRSILTALKISRCMLKDIYTNKTEQNTAVRLTESTKNILDLLLDLLSISLLLNMHKDANVRNYLFEFIFVLGFNYLRGHRKKAVSLS